MFLIFSHTVIVLSYFSVNTHDVIIVHLPCLSVIRKKLVLDSHLEQCSVSAVFLVNLGDSAEQNVSNKSLL